LEIEPGGSDPFYAHTVLSGGQPAGVITSAGFGHRTGTLLGLALLQPGTSDEDLSTLVVEQERAVRVLTEPPFDPENMRLRA
ncbi:MAG: glycine cleavage T C-terminal barrel domain-containing protein, partial [Pseudomonadota bacterium]